MVVGFILASRWYHNVKYEIVRDFRVDLVFAAIGALGGELSPFLFVLFSVFNDRSAVAGTRIYMPLFGFRVRVQEDGKVVEHFWFGKIVVCPPKA